MFIWTGAVYAQAGICVIQKPQITIRTVIENTRYVKDQSWHALTSAHKGAEERVGFERVTGLGGGTTDIAAEVKFIESQQGETACVTLTDVDILYSALPVVHVAENFPEGSCEYEAVMEHEQKHVFELENFHREYSMRLNDALTDILGAAANSGEIHISGVDNAKKNMEAFLIEKLETFRNKSTEILRERQNQIDTPEEYARVAAMCE